MILNLFSIKLFLFNLDIVEPFKIFQITDRWKVAAINTIVFFEVLEMLDKAFINSEILKLGVLIEIIIRFIFIILIG